MTEAHMTATPFLERVSNRTVIVAGGFDPLHRGHIAHIERAAQLGRRLVIITHPDEVLVAKKGYRLLPLEDRVAVLRGLRSVDEVVVSVDGDGLVARTLAQLAERADLPQPLIFVKGGDRTPATMPAVEVAVCQARGIAIVYEDGPKVQSSSDLVRDAARALRMIKLSDIF